MNMKPTWTVRVCNPDGIPMASETRVFTDKAMAEKHAAQRKLAVENAGWAFTVSVREDIQFSLPKDSGETQ